MAATTTTTYTAGDEVLGALRETIDGVVKTDAKRGLQALAELSSICRNIGQFDSTCRHHLLLVLC